MGVWRSVLGCEGGKRKCWERCGEVLEEVWGSVLGCGDQGKMWGEA